MGSPWDTARLLFRSRSGAVEKYQTSHGTVDVFDPRRGSVDEMPPWALYTELEEVARALPDLEPQYREPVARMLYASRHIPANRR